MHSANLAGKKQVCPEEEDRSFSENPDRGFASTASRTPSQRKADKQDLSVKNYPYYLTLVVAVIALGSCGEPPPLTAAENQRIDRAMERIEAEQDRTDKVERQKRTTPAELQQQRMIDATPVIEVQSYPIAQENLRQHPAPNIQIPPSSRNRTADTSRTGN